MSRRCVRCDALVDENGVHVRENFKGRHVHLEKYCEGHGHVFDVREMWENYEAKEVSK